MKKEEILNEEYEVVLFRDWFNRGRDPHGEIDDTLDLWFLMLYNKVASKTRVVH